MDIPQVFIQRYDALYNFWLAGVWTVVPPELICQRPHPRVNSIAWNLWHIARVEDAGLNRFVMDRPQVLDEGQWMERMNVPLRHHGTEMTFAEVDELNQRIDLPALHEYSTAVQARTREIISTLDPSDLDATLEESRIRQIIVNEGLAHSNAEGFIKNYLGWSKGKCLMNFGMTHPYQHVGEIGVIASLLGVEFE
ncbi:MAG: DinB family protein [Anaerolineales bacterium]